MENKQIWMTVLIAFAVGVLASLLTVWASGEALLGPDGTTLNTTKEINANRCQADGVCEMNSAKMVGPNGALTISPTYFEYVGDNGNSLTLLKGGSILLKAPKSPLRAEATLGSYILNFTRRYNSETNEEAIYGMRYVQLLSPNYNTWCCGPSNDGVWSCASGGCQDWS